MPVRDKNDSIAIFLNNGTGKKINLNELPLQKRAGKGLICYKTSKSTGNIACGALISDEDSILLIGTNSICISAKDIPNTNRSSLGNQLIKNSNIVSASKV